MGLPEPTVAQPEPGAGGDALLGFPHKIQLQTLDSCNYRCVTCPYPTLSEGKVRSRMEAGLLSRIIEQVREARRQIRLCLMLQNEPLLDRRFIDLLDEAHAADDAIFSIASVTNGSVLRAELLDRLVSYDRFHLTVSVNANDRERYHALHGVDLWTRLTDLLTTWSGPRHRLRLSFVMDRASVEGAREFWARWQAEGYQTRLLPILSRAGLVPLSSSRRPVEDDFNHCHYPVDTMTVIASGDVILCCQDWEHHETYGNLHEQSIRDIWTSPRMVEIREATIAGRIREAAEICRGCDYPMRSAVRMELESLVVESLAPASESGVLEHVAQLQLGGDSPLSVVVYDIDARAGQVACAVDGRGLPEGDEFSGSFAIAIAQSDRFQFGSMAPMWCPARVRRVGTVPGADEMPVAILSVDLDHGAEAFRLMPWYAADWRRAAHGHA